MLTLRLPTPTLLVEQGFAGFLAVAGCAWLGSAATHRQHPAPRRSHAVQVSISPPFVGQTLAETRCSREPALCSGYPGAPMPAPFFQQASAGVVLFCAGGPAGSAGLRELSSTGFRHGGLAAAPFPARNNRAGSGPFANRNFRRVSQRFAERAYRMAFSLASNASSWRFLNG